MFDSIWQDFKYHLGKGTRLNQLMLVNVMVFLLVLFVRIGFNIAGEEGRVGFSAFTEALSFHSNTRYLLTHPWILITHMFLHIGIWHLIWNMLMLYWFGNIVGDLIGNRVILPLYLVAGLMGVFSIYVFSQIFAYPSAEVIAYGASAAVMGFVLAATIIAPDFLMHLILIGPVKLKYIALVVVLLDLVGLAENDNTGGHIGHLGGGLGGILFIWWLKNGSALPGWPFRNKPETKIIPIRKKVSAAATGRKSSPEISKPAEADEDQVRNEIDRILDKIRTKGMDSLTKEERNTLEKASK